MPNQQHPIDIQITIQIKLFGLLISVRDRVGGILCVGLGSGSLSPDPGLFRDDDLITEEDGAIKVLFSPLPQSLSETLMSH